MLTYNSSKTAWSIHKWLLEAVLNGSLPAQLLQEPCAQATVGAHHMRVIWHSQHGICCLDGMTADQDEGQAPPDAADSLMAAQSLLGNTSGCAM